MKTINKKIIVSTLAITMGAALAGSVSGTVAWYQYSTRAQTSFIGSSGHCSELLQVSVDNGTTWQSEFVSNDLTTNALNGHDGSNIVPITTGNILKTDNVSNFYSNPIYQISAGGYDNWFAAEDDNYLQYKLLFKVVDVNENYDSDLLSKNLYLTDLTLEDATSGLDLSDALRVHIHTSANTNFLIAKTAEQTVTAAKLDLNGDGEDDQTEGYEWETGREDITYGEGKQTSYKASDIVATDNNGTIQDGVALGETGTDGTFSLTITVWLEGWQELSEVIDDEYPAIWDSTAYVNKAFHVGMRFAVPLHADGE